MGTGLLNPPSRGTCGLNTPKSTLDISHTRTRGAIFLVPARGKEEKPFDGLGLRDLPRRFSGKASPFSRAKDSPAGV